MGFNVIVPAAGIGTRLRPHTFTLPKVLLPVAGKPIIGHILDKIVALKPDKLFIIVGYMGEKLRCYTSETYPDTDIVFVEQEETKGLGHAISLVDKLIDKNKPLLIMLGDTLVELDLSLMLDEHYSALAVKEVEDPRRFGVVELDNGFIRRVIEKPEKPPSNLAIVGVYYFREASLLFEGLDHIIRNNITTKGEFQLTDALQYMLDKGSEFIPRKIGKWFDCGRPETLLETNKALLEKEMEQHHKNEKDYMIIPPVNIGKNVEIKESIIGPYVTIGDNAKIYHAIVSNSIIHHHAEINNLIIENSIIGERAEVLGQMMSFSLSDNASVHFFNETLKEE